MGFIRTFLERLVQREARPMLQPGDNAPDFTVNDHEGRSLSLADLRGRRAVLWFYPKADTPG
jgi:peroxiredoxin Q/BCP